MTRLCLLVTRDAQRAQDWPRRLRARGWSAEARASWAELAQDGAAGVLLVDLALAPRPADCVGRLRARRPSWRIALVAGPEDSFGPALSAALESGADDVVPASLSAAELDERLRRLASVGAQLLELSDGAIRLDRRQRQAWAGHEPPRRLALTRTEFEILAALLEAGGQALGREALIERVWRGEEVNAETVDRHVGALRRKLGRWKERIRTEHGKGYAAV